MLSAEELVREISGKSGKGKEEVKRLIEEKQVELSGLVSEEGAAYIVGRELGVELIRDTRRGLKIKNILPDMRSVNITAKVVSSFEPREFDRNGKKGVVASLILGDDTGTIRLPLWNDEVKLISSLGIDQDDILEVSGAWAKPDKRSDGVELRLGKRGEIKKIEGADAPDMGAVQSAPPSDPKAPAGPAQLMEIGRLKPGMNVQVKGCLVQVYKRKPYFEVCPQCGSRAEEKEGGFVCKDHGAVEPTYNLLLSGVIDDGTGNIRFVLFRDQAEKMLGKSADDVKREFDKEGPESFWAKFGGLGKDFTIEGRVKTNDFSNETEILANSVAETDVKEESKRLLKSLGK
ncbi:MAG: hypothetical protein JXC85_02960 [Candidatus Aenigmarchaeota archaeon]|nr:hypothetical protein [Candidatus Aenigmarchaeota archaeon]